MALFLTLLSGFCWTWVYVESIRIGIKEKTYAMPLFALALNFAWEVIHSYTNLTLNAQLTAQTVVILCWTTTDVLLLYTWARYGRRYWPGRLGAHSFYAWGLLVLFVSFVLQLLFVREFGVEAGARNAAFLQNVLMSVLFIDMLWRRKGAQGQSLTIAINKWLGTLAPTISVGYLEHRPFILGLGVLCSVFDLLYIGLLLRADLFAEEPQSSLRSFAPSSSLGAAVSSPK